MKPTTRQYLLASNWLPVGWHWAWSLSAVAAAMWKVSPSLSAFADPWFILTWGATLTVSFLVGWFASIIPAWFIFGPILYTQGLENGGPFVPGDRVRIIAGKFRGRVARVYATAQHETVRVDIGDREKERYTDIFAAYQLLRDDGEEQSVS